MVARDSVAAVTPIRGVADCWHWGRADPVALRRYEKFEFRLASTKLEMMPESPGWVGFSPVGRSPVSSFPAL